MEHPSKYMKGFCTVTFTYEEDFERPPLKKGESLGVYMDRCAEKADIEVYWHLAEWFCAEVGKRKINLTTPYGTIDFCNDTNRSKTHLPKGSISRHEEDVAALDTEVEQFPGESEDLQDKQLCINTTKTTADFWKGNIQTDRPEDYLYDLCKQAYIKAVYEMNNHPGPFKDIKITLTVGEGKTLCYFSKLKPLCPFTGKEKESDFDFAITPLGKQWCDEHRRSGVHEDVGYFSMINEVKEIWAEKFEEDDYLAAIAAEEESDEDSC